jgi:hypothetical protein
MSGPNLCFHSVCPVDCGSHGRCEAGSCVCDAGWQGVACKEPQCPNSCSGNGECLFAGPDQPASCTCSHGWSGKDCSVPAAFAQVPALCINDCSGHGKCVKGECICNSGFAGVACNDLDFEGGFDSPKVVKQTATLSSDSQAQQILEVVHHRHHHKAEKNPTSKVASEIFELSKKAAHVEAALMEAAQEVKVVNDIPEVNHFKQPKVSFLQESTLRKGHRAHVEMKP